MERISFNEISFWDVVMILVFISRHLFEYEKQPIIRLRCLNIYPLLHMLSFKVVSYIKVEGSFSFLYEGLFFFFLFVLVVFFLAGGSRKVSTLGNIVEKLFSGFPEYECVQDMTE